MSDSTNKYGVTISSNNSTFMVLSLTAHYAMVTTPVPWYQTLGIMWVSYVDSKKMMILRNAGSAHFFEKYFLSSIG